MLDTTASAPALILGDPVSWFSAPLLTGGTFPLHVNAGRWIVLSFLGSPATPRAQAELDALLGEAHLFAEDHLIVRAVFTAPPADIAGYTRLCTGAFSFLADYDGALSRAFGATDMPRTVVLDPMLRAVADIPWDTPQGHAQTVRAVLRSLPAVDESAGVAMTAPVLIVPRVFSFELCDFLMQFYDALGGAESGFLLDINGKTTTVIDPALKSRRDVPVAEPQVRELIRSHVVRRLVPAIATYFQFQATRMDRYVIACYDSTSGGHFFRHRDNLNAGSRHRRFAVSINLNGDYDGGELVFPEFGRRTYRPPQAGAAVFSCAALHQVTPVTRGRRYAFLAFLYGEEDAAMRAASNRDLHDGETHYSGSGDHLFPQAAS